MVKVAKGRLKQRAKRFSIVASHFNEFITKRLLDGCLKEFKRLGIPESHISIFWVPGSFEIPLVALRLAQKKTTDAVVCLGAVIRGETFHFELIARNTAQGIAGAALKSKKPVIFGVLTTDTVDQAYKRSQEKGDNKGRDAARAAVEMVNLLAQIQ